MPETTDPRLTRLNPILAERADQIRLNLLAIADGRPYINARLAGLPEARKRALFAADIANRALAGAIAAKGDKLHIIGAGDVTTAAYPETADISYADPTDTDTELEINIDRYFGIKVEDKDRLQANVSWEQIYSSRGGYKLRDDIDTLLLAEYANAALDSYESSTTPWQLGVAGADVPAFFAALSKQLDDVDAPGAGRFVILPSIGIQAIRLYVAGRNTSWGDQVAQNGKVGNLLGFDIYMSRNCAVVNTTVHGLAGVKGMNIAYAQQINPGSIESLRLEGRFATGVRGRVLAGIKTYRPGTLIDVNLNTTLLA